MSNNKSFTLPLWLDKIIYYTFGAIYEPRPTDVVYNPDKPYEFVQLYLGTYFPRSCAEAYCIASTLLSNTYYRNELINREEINILDFCCGTGGEIVGLVLALKENLPELKRVYVDAYDANPDAIRFLYHLVDNIEKTNELGLDLVVNPQGIYIASEMEIDDVVNLTNVQYEFILSSKAINEFVQHKTFDNNAYEIIATKFFPLLSQKGVFIMSDVTTQIDNSTLYYPQMMNDGLNKFIRKNHQFKTIVPPSCYLHEGYCLGCYMQDAFYVSHKKKDRDVSKIAYRVICRSDFAQIVMSNIPSTLCRADNPTADKQAPYNYGTR